VAEFLVAVQELQRREEAVRNGKLATIVFVRDVNPKGQEISGYIDYGDRLNNSSMDAVFQLKQRFVPKPTDLSFYNWDTHGSATNPTMDFQVSVMTAFVEWKIECSEVKVHKDCHNKCCLSLRQQLILDC
jgi:hypothetical protein